MSQNKAKKKAKERDGWECRFCGVTNEQHTQEYGRGLEAHHIIKDNDGGADHPRNLITVCRDCHTILENTQANALSRIKDEHTKDRRVKELESTNEELIERVKVLESENVETPVEVFTWLDKSLITIHLVYLDKYSPDVKIYRDRKEASEAYSEHDNAVRIERRAVDISDFIGESLRFISPEDMKASFNAYGDNYFKSGQAGSDYIAADIPEELR